MSLRLALLAILEASPATAYELAKRFDRSASSIWHASHSQIYPELKRMESEGLVDVRVLSRGTNATKRRYSITERGCERLDEWINGVQQPGMERSAEYLKATYLEWATFDNARSQFAAHLAHHRRQVERWEAHVEELRGRETELIVTRLNKAEPAAHEAIIAFKVHAYQGMIDRSRSEMQWAQQGLELVDRLETDSGLSADERLASPRPTSTDE